VDQGNALRQCDSNLLDTLFKFVTASDLEVIAGLQEINPALLNLSFGRR
jgi:hypothetical protein